MFYVSESKDYSRSPPRIPSRSRTQQQSRPVQSYNLPQGYRIVVSNLQANVTQEDIKVCNCKHVIYCYMF